MNSGEWWTEIGGAGPKPYNFASWRCFFSEETLVEDQVEVTFVTLDVYDSAATSPGKLFPEPLLYPLGTAGADPESPETGVAIDPSGNVLEMTAVTTLADDDPPGLLIGSVRGEVANGVLTITDWEHLNWHDDAPVRLGLKTLLALRPAEASIARVHALPNPFWVSLGFRFNTKGDSYLYSDL